MDMPRTKRIAIFGGTFSPPHRGHVEPILFVKENMELDRVIYVPAGIPPHKANQRIASNETRKKLLELALEGIPDVEIDTFELERTDVSYTYLTLEYFAAKYPDAKLFLLIGTDWAEKFNRWKNLPRILELATPLFMSREGCPYAADIKYPVIQVPKRLLSSTALREYLCKGIYDDAFVVDSIMPATLEYIKQKRLYEDATT